MTTGTLEEDASELISTKGRDAGIDDAAVTEAGFTGKQGSELSEPSSICSPSQGSNELQSQRRFLLDDLPAELCERIAWHFAESGCYDMSTLHLACVSPSLREAVINTTFNVIRLPPRSGHIEFTRRYLQEFAGELKRLRVIGGCNKAEVVQLLRNIPKLTELSIIDEPEYLAAVCGTKQLQTFRIDCTRENSLTKGENGVIEVLKSVDIQDLMICCCLSHQGRCREDDHIYGWMSSCQAICQNVTKLSFPFCQNDRKYFLLPMFQSLKHFTVSEHCFAGLSTPVTEILRRIPSLEVDGTIDRCSPTARNFSGLSRAMFPKDNVTSITSRHIWNKIELDGINLCRKITKLNINLVDGAETRLNYWFGLIEFSGKWYHSEDPYDDVNWQTGLPWETYKLPSGWLLAFVYRNAQLESLCLRNVIVDYNEILEVLKFMGPRLVNFYYDHTLDTEGSWDFRAKRYVNLIRVVSIYNKNVVHFVAKEPSGGTDMALSKYTQMVKEGRRLLRTRCINICRCCLHDTTYPILNRPRN